ncbi:407_t:CDS:1 [Cetraspora pellucida]|uniref:407_t:CDS:1 n=1 Tax=Cetraspora pellucida TaxID=1433469 RepID=A0ACA9LJI1_9GLOM|nr:407_t:CDS:1 [Cetraspora pellucida]
MNNLLENRIEVENDQSSRPTTPHMQVIPANQSVESWVWLFVNKQTRCCQVIIEDKSVRHQCKWSCQKKTSTTNIASHLRVKHQIIEGKEEAEVINSETHNRNFLLKQSKINRITYHLIDWLIDDMQAFHVVENRKFQNFVYELESFYSIPCKNSLYKKISEVISIVEQNLNESMNSLMESFFFTTDLWTQNHTHYIGITIH